MWYCFTCCKIYRNGIMLNNYYLTTCASHSTVFLRHKCVHMFLLAENTHQCSDITYNPLLLTGSHLLATLPLFLHGTSYSFLNTLNVLLPQGLCAHCFPCWGLALLLIYTHYYFSALFETAPVSLLDKAHHLSDCICFNITNPLPFCCFPP